MSLQAGTMITPSLRLSRPLGAGGMGQVWVAEHIGLQANVVVKFMAPELSGDAEATARFQREAAAAAAVRSPHVVQTIDFGVASTGSLYLAMELLEGKDLRALLQERGTLAATEVVAIATQVGKALDRAHERGVVHRDIKPENIFLVEQGEDVFVKVLDFGIAKASHTADLKTRTGSVVGTPHYMSPEQVLGSKTVGPATDLWALAIVVFVCLTGRRPFEGETIGALSIAICHAPLPRPSEIDPALAPLDEWFARACAREPATRFASAREMTTALASACQGVTGTVRAIVPGDAPSTASGRTTLRASVAELPAPPARRGLRVALLLAGLGVAGALVGTLAFAIAHRGGPSEIPTVVNEKSAATAASSGEPAHATSPPTAASSASAAPSAAPPAPPKSSGTSKAATPATTTSKPSVTTSATATAAPKVDNDPTIF